MEKIIEKDVMDQVFEVIDKHIRYHEKRMDELKVFRKFCPLIFEMSDLDEDANSSASAIAALEMLKRELNGEVEY